MNKLVTVIVGLVLVGCSSAPKNPGYVKHVNTLNYANFSPDKINFVLPSQPQVSLEAVYDRSATGTAPLAVYDGSAGLIGVFVQAGMQSSAVQSQRNKIRTEAQKKANSQIQPLIESAKGIETVSLLGDYVNKVVPESAKTATSVFVNPLFYSETDFSKLSMKLVFWIPKTAEQLKKSKKSKRKNRSQNQYNNLVQVFSDTISESEAALLAEGDQTVLHEKMTAMLQQGLQIVEKELAGNYSQVESKMKTIVIEEGSSKRVVRGKVVDNICGIEVVQNLHSWFVAVPSAKKEVAANSKPDQIEQCS